MFNLTGRLARNAEILEGTSKTTGKPYAMCRYTIAEPAKRPGKNGKYDPTYVEVKQQIRSDKQRDYLKSVLIKGQLISTSGVLRSNRYTDAQGQTQYATDRLVDRVNIIRTGITAA